MSWKDISKSSYTVESAKFTLPRPSHPFTIPYQEAKVVYSEGDELTSVADYRFNLDFTGDPLGPNHFPCGYWHKNYIPPFTIIYTSLLYPVEVFDGIDGEISFINGVFRSLVIFYSAYIESINTSLFDIVSGSFRHIIISYPYQESIQTSTFNIVSGQFKETIRYTIPTESIITNSFNMIAGRFRDSVINYDYALPENIQTTSFTIIGGTHAN